jgi:hypothetical protein
VGEWMRIAPGGSRKAEKVRDRVLISFDVLASQAVGAVDDQSGELPGDELDGFVVQGPWF